MQGEALWFYEHGGVKESLIFSNHGVCNMLSKLHETLRSNHPTIVANYINICVIQFKTTVLLHLSFFPTVPALGDRWIMEWKHMFSHCKYSQRCSVTQAPSRCHSVISERCVRWSSSTTQSAVFEKMCENTQRTRYLSPQQDSSSLHWITLPFISDTAY